MTDVPHRTWVRPTRPRVVVGLSPVLPWVVVFVGAAGGFFIGRMTGGDADLFERNLLLLLRFMAAMKLLGVLAAAGLTHWRLMQPIAPRAALAYLGAVATMALATGLIFSLGGIAIGAILFHIGLIAFLVLAWRDDGCRVGLRN